MQFNRIIFLVQVKYLSVQGQIFEADAHNLESFCKEAEYCVSQSVKPHIVFIIGILYNRMP